MKNWQHEWLFPGGKIHRERSDEHKSAQLVHMLCGVPVYFEPMLRIPENGELLMPAVKVPPAFITSSTGRKYKVRYCKTCVRLSRSERTAA